MLRARIITSGSEKSKKIEEELARILKNKGIQVGIENPDVIFVVGGDGTLIRAIKLGKPIVAVKSGRKANLLDVSVEQLEEVVERLLNSKYEVEEFMLLEYELGKIKGIAFNEIGIMFDKPQTILASIIIDNDEIISFEGDGILVSTPQGNWAWSFYITNTIIYKKLPIIQITILNPIKTNLRSIIVPDHAEIKIRLEEKGRPQSIRLISDGETIDLIPVSSDKVIKIRNSKDHKGIIYRFNKINIIRELICNQRE